MSSLPNVVGDASTIDRREAHIFDWGSIQWLVSESIFSGAAITVGHVEIRAGTKNPRHQHPNCDEVLVLLEGELDHTVDDRVTHLKPGMAIFIPRGIGHDAVNTGSVTARMIVAYSSGDRETVMLEEKS
jgi:quercetin dioxygenase-like cupin family protein